MADPKRPKSVNSSLPDPSMDDWESVDRGSSHISSPRSDQVSTAAIKSRSPNSAPKTAPVGLFVVIILLVLAALGVGGYFLWTQVLQPMLGKPAAAQVTAAPAKPDTQAPAKTDEKPAAPQTAPGNVKLLGVHPVVKGDTLWWISDKWYTEPRYWPLIYRINKDEVPNPDLLLPGQKLDIPALAGTKDNLTAEDKASLGEGYLEAYRAYKEKGKADAEDFKTVGDTYLKK